MNWLWSLFSSKNEIPQVNSNINYFEELIKKQKEIAKKYEKERENYILYQKKFTDILLDEDPHIAFRVIKILFPEKSYGLYNDGNPIFYDKIKIMQNINLNINYADEYDLKYNSCINDINNALIKAIKDTRQYDENAITNKINIFINKFNARYNQYNKIYREYLDINKRVNNYINYNVKEKKML